MLIYCCCVFYFYKDLCDSISVLLVSSFCLHGPITVYHKTKHVYSLTDIMSLMAYKLYYAKTTTTTTIDSGDLG